MAKFNLFNKVLNFFSKPNRVAPAPKPTAEKALPTKKKYEREDTPQIDTSDESLSSRGNSLSDSPSSKKNTDKASNPPTGFRRR